MDPMDCDGVSLLPILTEGDQLDERTLYWRMDTEKAVRDREWKLIINEDNSTELYNLKNDIGEEKRPCEPISGAGSVDEREISCLGKGTIAVCGLDD